MKPFQIQLDQERGNGGVNELHPMARYVYGVKIAVAGVQQWAQYVGERPPLLRLQRSVIDQFDQGEQPFGVNSHGLPPIVYVILKEKQKSASAERSFGLTAEMVVPTFPGNFISVSVAKISRTHRDLNTNSMDAIWAEDYCESPHCINTAIQVTIWLRIW